MYRIIPSCPTGRCAVVPTGIVIAPVPGITVFGANEKTGLFDPFPSVTLICCAVPNNSRPAIVVPPTTARNPVPETCAMANAIPVNAIVGLPAMPLPFVIDRPSPETAIERFMTDAEPVLTITPFDAASRLPEAPLSTICRYDCAPLSVRPIPVPPCRNRLFGSDGS